MSDHLRSLQALRFAAALGVVWEHAATRADPHNFTGGGMGVDVFFVLSGFVITRAAITRPETFLRDRLTRIYPTYWLWALGWIALAAMSGPLDGWRLFTTATLLPAPTSTPIDPYAGIAWTLCFEVMFYAAVWLVLRGVRPLWLILAYGAAAGLALATGASLARFVGSPMVLEFLMGVLAFGIGRRSRLLGGIALALACAWLPFMPKGLVSPYVVFTPLMAMGRVAMWGVPAFLVVWGAAQFDCRGRLWTPLVLLGDASYTLYLSHLLLFEVFQQVTGRPAAAIAGAVVAVAFGLLAYLVAERPLLRLVRQITRPAPQGALAPAE